MFGEQLAWGVGAPLQMGEMCLVPPPPQYPSWVGGGLQQSPAGMPIPKSCNPPLLLRWSPSLKRRHRR